MYRPKEAEQMTTMIKLQSPTTASSYGVKTKSFIDTCYIQCNFKTYGGTDKIDNNILFVEDTASITCWYDPQIKSDCRIILCDGTENEHPKYYEIIGEPENIEMRNQFIKFKVRRIKGGA